MAGRIGTQAIVTIDSASQGNVRLRRCKSSKLADGATTEAVNAMGEDDPVGYKDKPGAKTITLDVYQEQGKPEVDYKFLKRSKEYFSLTREIVNGQEFQYTSCRVAKIDEDDDDEGSHMMSVEILALREQPL